MTSRIPPTLFILLLLATLVTPSETRAQGFGVYEQGTCVMGRAGATVADACEDGSAIFFNPAGLTGPTGLTITAGVTAIFADGKFVDDRTATATDLANDAIPVPHAYASYGITERFAAGLGVYVPYGLATEWPIEFSGRFIGFDNRLQSTYFQPTIAYQITDRLTLGAGATLVLGSVELNQRLDLADQAVPSSLLPSDLPNTVTQPVLFSQFGIPPQTDFTSATLEADGATGLGGNFGLEFRATRWLQLGARYMMEVPLDYDGDASFSQVPTGLKIPTDIELGETTLPAGTPVDNLVAPQFQNQGALVDQDVETKITMPAQFVAGVKLTPVPSVHVYIDYQWANWASFDTIPLDFERDALDTERIENFNDSHALRFGTEYALAPTFDVRVGYLWHGPAAPDETVTPLLPDGTRNQGTVGLTWRFIDVAEVSLAYQYLHQNDRRGRVGEPVPGVEPTQELNSGVYSFGAHLAAVSLTLRL